MSRLLHYFAVSINGNKLADMRAEELPALIGGEIRRLGYPTVGQGGATDYLMTRLYQCAEHFGYDKNGMQLGAAIPTEIERDMKKSNTISYRIAENLVVEIRFRLQSADINPKGKSHLTRVGDNYAICGRRMKWFGSREWLRDDFSSLDMCSQCVSHI